MSKTLKERLMKFTCGKPSETPATTAGTAPKTLAATGENKAETRRLQDENTNLYARLFAFAWTNPNTICTGKHFHYVQPGTEQRAFGSLDFERKRNAWLRGKTAEMEAVRRKGTKSLAEQLKEVLT